METKKDDKYTVCVRRVTSCNTKWKSTRGTKNSWIVPFAYTGLQRVQIKQFSFMNRESLTSITLRVKVDEENTPLRILWKDIFLLP